MAGGVGSRISEEARLRPKPMIEIGGRPILWHIMKIYAAHGIGDFIVCLGYRGYMIKEYFANYWLHARDVTVDLGHNTMEIHEGEVEPWRVTLVDTGDETQTGGRLNRVLPYVDEDEFCFTYGDGVTDLDIRALIDFHRNHGKLATVTAVQPPGRFGALEIEGELVRAFTEKPHGDRAWINGGFFVLSPKVGEYIDGDQTVWEGEPLERLAHEGQLSAYRYEGFWHMMDALRDRNYLEERWRSGGPWKVW